MACAGALTVDIGGCAFATGAGGGALAAGAASGGSATIACSGAVAGAGLLDRAASGCGEAAPSGSGGDIGVGVGGPGGESPGAGISAGCIGGSAGVLASLGVTAPGLSNTRSYEGAVPSPRGGCRAAIPITNKIAIACSKADATTLQRGRAAPPTGTAGTSGVNFIGQKSSRQHISRQRIWAQKHRRKPTLDIYGRAPFLRGLRRTLRRACPGRTRFCRGVAQLARAPVSKTGGWGFETLHPCQSFAESSGA